VDDVVTFPGRMYAFVNFQHAKDAARAQEALDGKEVRILGLPSAVADLQGSIAATCIAAGCDSLKSQDCKESAHIARLHI